MAVFRFRLAQLLRLRQAIEDMEKRELQQRITTFIQAEQALQQAQARRTAFIGDTEKEEALGVEVARLAVLRRWYPVLAEQEAISQQLAVEAEEAVDQQREQVKQAHLETRILQRLRERLLADFKVEIERQEQSELDELAACSWAREDRS